MCFLVCLCFCAFTFNESTVRCIILRIYYATHISSFRPQVMEKVGKILTISRASSMRTLGFHIITPSSTTFNCRISLVLCGTHDHPMSPDTYTAVVILNIWSQIVFDQTFTKITIKVSQEFCCSRNRQKLKCSVYVIASIIMIINLPKFWHFQSVHEKNRLKEIYLFQC